MAEDRLRMYVQGALLQGQEQVVRPWPIIGSHGQGRRARRALLAFAADSTKGLAVKFFQDGREIENTPEPPWPSARLAMAQALAGAALDALEDLQRSDDPAVANRVRKAYFALIGAHSTGAKQRLLLHYVEALQDADDDTAADGLLAATLDVAAVEVQAEDLDELREQALETIRAWRSGGSKWAPANKWLARFGLESASPSALKQVMKGRDW